ncbi:hypothetical protein BaRGS_00010188 [Batillaria attramentaria]|uniref:Uncharacterized protein n=1 Tax=Batillaria attramentaria TaxID=370345 RepID=A0ABD0LHE9_9CAEN
MRGKVQRISRSPVSATQAAVTESMYLNRKDSCGLLTAAMVVSELLERRVLRLPTPPVLVPSYIPARGMLLSDPAGRRKCPCGH